MTFRIGPLLLGKTRLFAGGELIEHHSACYGGVLYSGPAISLSTRRSSHESGYLLPRSALFIGWKL